MTSRTALYCGSFDPLTRGHIDIIRQAQSLFDTVIVGIGNNPKKVHRFTVEERKTLIRESLRESGLPPVEVIDYSGSIIREARGRGVSTLVRGLRQISDFGDEFTINGMVARSLPNVPITYFICRQDFLHVSSSSAKEMVGYGEDISWMVTPIVESALCGAFEF